MQQKYLSLGRPPKVYQLNNLIWLLISMPFFSACATAVESPPVEVTPTAAAEIAVPTATSVEATTPASTATAGATPTVLADAAQSGALISTIRPEPLTGYIPNPGMGWQDTQPKDKRFGETVSYRRFNWSDLNPAKGTYDWSLIEKLRADAARSKEAMSFRIRTVQPPPWGGGQMMPTWLVAQGALITEGYSEVEDVRSSEPLYPGCLFLAAHSQFIEALRQKYDGDPDIAFIDVGSYGAYGEWHSEQYNPDPGSLDWHARRRIIDMYLGGQGTRPCLDAEHQVKEVAYDYPGFQHTQLIMPYTPWFDDSLVYALSHRADIGIRHDALGSEKHQKRYREEIGQWVEQRWPKAPIIFELTSTADTPEALGRARDFAQEMHASFIHDNLNGRGDNKLMAEMLAVIGYRLSLQEISYTSELNPGEILSFAMTWENTGAAPPYYKTYPLLLSLTDAQGVPVLDQQLDPDIRTWLPGQPVRLQGELHLPTDLPPGRYDLRVAFIDPATHQPILALAIAGRDEQGRYLLGPVDVLKIPINN